MTDEVPEELHFHVPEGVDMTDPVNRTTFELFVTLIVRSGEIPSIKTMPQDTLDIAVTATFFRGMTELLQNLKVAFKTGTALNIGLLYMLCEQQLDKLIDTAMSAPSPEKETTQVTNGPAHTVNKPIH